ncbi:hypothetical protein HPB49_002788 [Dermacentor silvarum]|uniref:Uncharacterized protein n=1 Tax=Dermacentor silvarum TaxID=543639 RepID=A0ACB8CPB1_DERSI|nr:hypothetical protein HPB49_002788 [Dermacentor silvarum]
MSKASPVSHASGTSRGRDGAKEEYSCATDIPCAKYGDTRCQLLDRRYYINEIILDAGMELREDVLSKHSGDVCIGVVRASTCGQVFFSKFEDSRKRNALDLVEYLLFQHHCITALELNGSSSCRPSLLEALEDQRSVKSLTVYGVLRIREAAFFIRVMNSLSQLDKLVFKVNDSRSEWNFPTPRFAYSLDLRIHHLTALDVADLQMTRQEAMEMVQTLMLNHSISDLAVGLFVFSTGAQNSGTYFAQYLTRENSKLRRLTLKTNAICDNGYLLMTLIDALCEMTTLEELNADIIMNVSGLLALFAKLFAQSNTLRRLRLPSTFCKRCSFLWFDPTERPGPDAAQCMEPWLKALRMPKSMPSELRIDLRGFGEAECRAFFDAVADNDALKSIIVDSLPAVDGVDRICRTIRDRGLGDRVTIRDLYIDQANLKVLPQCAEIGSVIISARHLLRQEYADIGAVSSALEVVSRCGHVTSLRVKCNSFDNDTLSALVACIRGSTALTDVDVRLGSHWTKVVEEQREEMETKLVSALASNPKLARVSVRGALLSSHNLSLLAEGARKSRNITEFKLTPACISDATNAETCSWHAAELLCTAPRYLNIALTNIQEITARNTSLLPSAVKYVLGEQDDVKCIRTMELMHDHPRLLELVREGAASTKSEAKKMISSALLSVRRTNIHQFMRLAGVVKEKVDCLANPGATTQLADISEDCWLHIRSFLKIADVVQA